MKAETFKQTTEVLGNPKIMISIGIIVLIIGIVIAIFWKKIKNAIDEAKQDKKNEKKVDEVESFTQKTQTYPDSYYVIFADQLDSAMRGCGTREEEVFNIIGKIKNDVDFIKLNNAFGTRKNQNLGRWIHGDFNEKDIKKINEILKRNGVTMGF